MKFLSIGLISIALLSSPAFAKRNKDEEKEKPPARCGEITAHTVFLKQKTGNRKKGSAELISEQHRLAEKSGWNFDELSVYVENGDLQGFFITYTRPHPCNENQP